MSISPLQAIVLDGRNGKVLWIMNSTDSTEASALVARTTDTHRDSFVFSVQGLADTDNSKVMHYKHSTN